MNVILKLYFQTHRLLLIQMTDFVFRVLNHRDYKRKNYIHLGISLSYIIVNFFLHLIRYFSKDIFIASYYNRITIRFQRDDQKDKICS